MITLGETIQILESLSPERRKLVVPDGFGFPHSWRGIYAELAFEPTGAMSIQAILDSTKTALNTTFGGWKGGEYTMTENTKVHLSQKGYADDEYGDRFERRLYLILRYAITYAEVV